MTKCSASGIIINVVAGMVELADTSVLEADAERREGSSPFTRTTNEKLCDTCFSKVMEFIFLLFNSINLYYLSVV